METYTIILTDGTKLQGYKNIEYAGHDVYAKETYESSDVFPVSDIYFTEDLKEIIKE